VKLEGDTLLRSWAQYPMIFFASAFLFWNLVIEGNRPTVLHILFIICLALIVLVEIAYHITNYFYKRRTGRSHR